MNLRVIIIERLTQKVQIQRPGVRADKVRDWVKIEELTASSNLRILEDMLENLSDDSKGRI